MSTKKIRILISSPGDVAEERAKAQQVITDLGEFYESQATLEAVLWEDLSLPATEPFQDGIDYFLMQKPIDIAVFILWSRLGSPLGASIKRKDGTSYRSGTEREFDLMLAAFEQSGRKRPLILAYTRKDESTWKDALSECHVDEIEEMIRQRKLSESFIREQFTDLEGRNQRAYHSYDKPVSFAQRLRSHLQAAIDDLLGTDNTVPRWTEAPYRSLEVFEIKHAPIFFGRSEETCDVIDRLRKQHDSGSGFVVIVGASGSGKSSLARAGVAASLVQHPYDDSIHVWKSIVFTPANFGDKLLPGLVQSVCEVFPEICSSSASIDDIADGLAKATGTTIKLALIPVFKQAAEKAGGEIRLLIVLDQMEELWTHKKISEQNREQFLEIIEALTKTLNVDVIATLRSDFYAKAQSSPAFLKLKGDNGQIDLVAPSTTALQRMIVEPARMAGFRFERDERTGKTLDQIILEEASSDRSALPLLQFALSELYESRTAHDRTLTFAAYEHMGGVMGAIGQQATNMFAKLPGSTQAALSEILPLLVSVDSENENEAVRRRALMTELTLTDDRKALTQALIAARFLVTDREESDPIISLAHEALLLRWDALVTWVNNNRNNLRLRAGIEQSQKRWEQSNCHPSLLLSTGLPIEEGKKLLLAANHFLTTSSEAYIKASIVQAEAVERNRLNRQKVAFTCFAILTTFAIGGAMYAWLQRNVAIFQAQIAVVETKKAIAAEGKAKEQELLANCALIESRQQEAKALEQEHVAKIAAQQSRESERIAEQAKQAARVQATLAESRFNELTKQAKEASAALLSFGVSEYQSGRPKSGDTNLIRAWRLREEKDPLKVSYSRVLSDGLTQGGRSWVIIRHEDKVNSVCFSPDGSIVATASSDKTARLWNAMTGASVGEKMRHDARVNSVSFSPNGMYVVTASDDKSARIWDATTGTPHGVHMQHKGNVRSASFSPDGTRLATASDDKTARIWDARTGKPIGEPLRHDDVVNAASFSFDGTLLATASDDKTARLWDALSGVSLAMPMRHEDKINSVCFSPDGTRLATASDDRTTRLWNAKTCEQLAYIQQLCPVKSVSFSPDGMRLATKYYGDPFGMIKNSVCLFDLNAGKLIREPIQHATSVCFSADGSLVATACDDKTTRLFDSQTGTPVGEPMRTADSADYASFSPAGSTVATTVDDNSVVLWDIQLCTPLCEIPKSGDYFVCFSPNGTLLLTGMSGGNARVRDAFTGAPFGVPILTTGYTTHASFSPDGRYVATAGLNGVAELWDPTTGTRIGKPMAHSDYVNCISFSPDGKYLATASKDNTARLWDAMTGAPLGKPMVHADNVNCIAFSPDGKRIATASRDCSAHLWDVQTCAKINVQFRHKEGVTSVSFSPDGTRIATASFDNTARLWDLQSGFPLGQPMHHEEWVSSVTFSSDGTRIATSSADKTARVWDAWTGAPLGGPLRHPEEVTFVSFSPDGMRLATACDDDKARIWDSEVFAPKEIEWLIKRSEMNPRESIPKDETVSGDLTAFRSRRTLRYRVTTTTKAIADRNWSVARFHLPWLCNNEPKNVRWKWMLALADCATFADKGDWGEALKHANRAVELESTNETQRARWLCSLAKNDLAEIKFALRGYLEFAELSKEEHVWSDFVNDINLYVNPQLNRKRIHAIAEKARTTTSLAGSHYRIGNLKDAESTFRDVRDNSSNDYESHAFRAMTYHRLNQPEESLKQRQILSELPPATEWQERLRRKLLSDEVEKTCKELPGK